MHIDYFMKDTGSNGCLWRWSKDLSVEKLVKIKNFFQSIFFFLFFVFLLIYHGQVISIKINKSFNEI